MVYPTGLHRFAWRSPTGARRRDRRAARGTTAAGMSMAGLHPVVAIYATFLNRAFDQVLMDVALHRCGVTFVLDRAGITGPDGASHHGMWDMSILQLVPGLHLARPETAPGCGRRWHISGDRRCSQRDPLPQPAGAAGHPAVDSVAGMDILLRTDHPRVLVVAYGELARPVSRWGSGCPTRASA